LEASQLCTGKKKGPYAVEIIYLSGPLHVMGVISYAGANADIWYLDHAAGVNNDPS